MQLTVLVSALGGSLSLYLGISLSMVFEVLEFIVDVVIGLFQSCPKKNNVR